MTKDDIVKALRNEIEKCDRSQTATVAANSALDALEDSLKAFIRSRSKLSYTTSAIVLMLQAWRQSIQSSRHCTWHVSRIRRWVAKERRVKNCWSMTRSAAIASMRRGGRARNSRVHVARSFLSSPSITDQRAHRKTGKSTDCIVHWRCVKAVFCRSGETMLKLRASATLGRRRKRTADVNRHRAIAVPDSSDTPSVNIFHVTSRSPNNCALLQRTKRGRRSTVRTQEHR